MSYDLVIVDGNSICHAAHHATKLTSGSMQTQAIFGTIKSMKVLAEKYASSPMLVLWDGKAQWRYDLYPEYKGNRAATDEKKAADKEAYKAQSPFVRKGLQLLGLRQLLATTAEADDMAGIMVRRSKPTSKILLVTGDRDWLQLVRENVSWFDPIRDIFVDQKNFTEVTGYFSPREFLDGKALMGDSSDNISPVGGIGEKGAPEFLAQFKSVENFYKQVEEGSFVPKKKAHTNLTGDGRAIYYRNLRLMNLLDVPEPDRADISLIAPTYDEAKFQMFCEKLAFMSILRDFDSFMTPFREMQPALRKAA